MNDVISWLRARPLIFSLLLHASLAAGLCLLPFGICLVRPPSPITVEVLRHSPELSSDQRLSPPVPTPPTTPTPTQRSNKHRHETMQLIAQPAPASATTPVPATGPAPATAEKRDPNTVNLFPSNLLGTLAVTRREGKVGPSGALASTGAHSLGVSPEETAGRVRDIFDDMAGQQGAAAGKVPPAWRDAERKMAALFHPSIDMVTDDNAGKGFLSEWLRSKPSSEPTVRGIDPGVEAAEQRYGQVMSFAQNSPDWMRTEIEATIDSDGTLLSIRVAVRSGRRRLDAEALAAVERALLTRELKDPRGRVTSRWAIEAALRVASPLALGLSFDESSGKVGGVYPMKKDVNTRISLLWIKVK